MESNSYVVYVHICPNEKRYYGYTSQKPEQRWRNGHGYKKRNPEFYDDIITYGWTNIQHLIVADNLSKEEAALLEEQLILENKSYDSEFGYNKHIGNKYTDEQKERVSGENHPLYGKHHSEETKRKISENHKNNYIKGC